MCNTSNDNRAVSAIRNYIDISHGCKGLYQTPNIYDVT